MIEKQLAKISSVSVGFGGYDDAMFGVSVAFTHGCWGVNDFKGWWAAKPGKNAKWTREDQIKRWGENMEWLKDLMRDAKVESVAALRNTPVELTLENNQLKSWRILTEVI